MRSGNAHEKPYRRMQKSKMAQYRRTEGTRRDTFGEEKQQKSRIICRRIQLFAKKVVTLYQNFYAYEYGRNHYRAVERG